MHIRSLVASLMVVAGPALAGPREDALSAYMKFFDTFTSDNHDRMVTLFAPSVQFFGTQSTEVVTDLEGVRKYFVRALTSARGVVKARPLEQTAIALSDSVVLISGKWQSERTLEGTMTTGGPSRNTVVMQKVGDRWLIAQFHNSPTPKPAAPPALPKN